MTGRTVTVPDGTRLYVDEIGDGDLTLLVPAACWLERDLDRLAANDVRIVFYDQRNRGRSDRSGAETILFAQEAEDLETVRQSLGDAPVVTLGWSYLGAVVALHARRYPRSVRGVIMVAPMAPRDPDEGHYEIDDEVRQGFAERWRTYGPRIEQVEARLAIGPVSLALRREHQRLNSAARMAAAGAIDRMRSEPWRYENEWPEHRDATFAALFGGLADRDWRQGMGVITTPVLIVHGESDGPIAMSRDWADALPDAQLIGLPGVGHFPWLEEPDVFDEAVKAFLARVKRLGDDRVGER